MKDFREQNYYELLEVTTHSSLHEIEASYRRARRAFASDSVATYALFSPEELVLLRRRIEEAYRVLTDAERRRRYDRELSRLDFLQWSEEDAPADAGPRQRQGQERKQETDQEPAGEDQPSLPLVEPQSSASMAASTSPEEVHVSPESTEPEKSVETAAADEPPEAHSSKEKLVTSPAEPTISEEGQIESEPVDDTHSVVAESADRQPEQLPPMPKIDDDTSVDGQLLRRVRLARGLELEDIAETTKISIYYLRKLENEDFTDLPARVYVRGYLKQICALLGVDAGRIVNAYLARLDAVAAGEREREG